MTEQQITYFITLVEECSFTKAAKKLYITQPSFSQYIQAIEIKTLLSGLLKFSTKKERF